MLLQELLELDWVEDLHESMNTKIPVDSWKQEGNELHGFIEIDSEIFRIELQPITYQEYNAINVGFSKIVDDHPTQEIIVTSKNASKVIGAVANAIMDKLNEFTYDAIVFIAASAVDQRMRIYNIVAKKFHQMFKAMIPNVKLQNGQQMTILLGRSFPNDKIEDFKQHIQNVTK